MAMEQLELFARDEDRLPAVTVSGSIQVKVLEAMAQLLVELAAAAKDDEHRSGDDEQDP